MQHIDFFRVKMDEKIKTRVPLVFTGHSAAVKEKGLLRLEGKEYIVKDGDVIYFRFNV